MKCVPTLTMRDKINEMIPFTEPKYSKLLGLYLLLADQNESRACFSLVD